MTELTEKLLTRLQEEDAQAFGDLQVQKAGNTYFISGFLYTAISHVEDVFQEVVEAFDPHGYAMSTVKTPKAGLTLTETSSTTSKTTWSQEEEGVLDEVTVLHLGMVDRKLLTLHPSYKRMNFETFEKVKSVVTVMDVLAPIVVDKNFQIIDGNLRLEVAAVLERKTVPVMVLNCEGDKADLLRLVLNRSSEFQRWIYQDVDDLVDKLPQAQPLLEPLGFFSKNILPTTFFGNTVLEYTIDEYNDQMKQYSQDIGLAEWAKMRKEEILEEEAERQRRRNSGRPSSEGRVSLFDLMANEEDFVPVHNPQEVVKEHVEAMKDVAGTITDNYDAKRKAEKEARGQVWQTSRRTSKKKAADKRAAAEADALDGDVKGEEDE